MEWMIAGFNNGISGHLGDEYTAYRPDFQDAWTSTSMISRKKSPTYNGRGSTMADKED